MSTNVVATPQKHEFFVRKDITTLFKTNQTITKFRLLHIPNTTWNVITSTFRGNTVPSSECAQAVKPKRKHFGGAPPGQISNKKGARSRPSPISSFCPTFRSRLGCLFTGACMQAQRSQSVAIASFLSVQFSSSVFFAWRIVARVYSLLCSVPVGQFRLLLLFFLRAVSSITRKFPCSFFRLPTSFCVSFLFCKYILIFDFSNWLVGLFSLCPAAVKIWCMRRRSAVQSWKLALDTGQPKLLSAVPTLLATIKKTCQAVNLPCQHKYGHIALSH